LLDNAVKYTPQNGKMSLQLQKTRRYAVITLTNTGEGIPQEKIDHIFDRFYKVDSSHKDTGNSFGLGLSIAKSIVDSLKGRIKCESQLGEYTRFTVELPLSALNFLPKNNY
ncbi:MAG: ATP-binding protein, partial [Clostridia bacterium]|nr:ATP-binding protein [Clostridia bacterium]